MEAHRAKLIEGGKLIIPAPMRKSLGLATGDVVMIEMDKGELRIRTLDKALARAPARSCAATFRKVIPSLTS